MFVKVEGLLEEIALSMKTTNKLLTKIEENLRVPDVVTWAKAIQEIRYDMRKSKSVVD